MKPFGKEFSLEVVLLYLSTPMDFLKHDVCLICNIISKTTYQRGEVGIHGGSHVPF